MNDKQYIKIRLEFLSKNNNALLESIKYKKFLFYLCFLGWIAQFFVLINYHTTLSAFFFGILLAASIDRWNNLVEIEREYRWCSDEFNMLKTA